MKRVSYLHLAVGCLSLLATLVEAQPFRSMAFGEGENQSTLTIKSDGSCVFTNEAVQPRRTLEMQISSWERYEEMAERAGSEDGDPSTPPPQPAEAAKKALANEELASKLREISEQQPDFGESDSFKIESIPNSTNLVRLVTGRSFPSLKDLMSQSPYMWGPLVLMLEDARIEVDTNTNLRITFTGSQGAGRHAKTAIRGWKASKIKFTWRLVLPGKILTSGLPNMQDNATWLNLDAEKPDSMDTAAKLIGPPLVITSELAGLKLDEPLESKKLNRAAWTRRGYEPDMPITDAPSGFVAEAVSITLTTVHTFPEAEKYFKDGLGGFTPGMDSPGAVISAKLFPPNGRKIQSVSGLRVKAARDDRGRAIPEAVDGGDSQEGGNELVSYNQGGAAEGGSARIEIRMALPAADAKAIDELDAEAVALTIGGWNEMVLTNVHADASREINLEPVLPGAKLIIKKPGGKKQQKSVEATLEGPASVNQLEVRIMVSSQQGGQSHMSDRRGRTSGEKTTRDITIQAYDFEAGDEAQDAPPTLVVRSPQDIKRERVQFKLSALDLL